jgi:hypothetical protein
MSYDGSGKPGKGPGRRAMSLNGMPLSVTRAAKRIACNVSQQRVGAGTPAAMKLCYPLDAKRHQRSSGAAWPPGRKQTIADRLILMGDWRDSFAAMI